MSLTRSLPWALVWLRLLLAPLMLFLAWAWPLPGVFACCLAAAFLSDVFDGALARRWGTVTSTLRRMDSAVDMLFCLAALGAVWLCRPAVIRDAGILLVVLLCLEVLRYAVDLTKFGREASYHMWSSKLWAAVLYLSFFMVLVLGESGGWVTAVLLLGIVSDLEGLMVSLVLPEWHYDVPSLVHAWRLRHSSR